MEREPWEPGIGSAQIKADSDAQEDQRVAEVLELARAAMAGINRFQPDTVKRMLIETWPKGQIIPDLTQMALDLTLRIHKEIAAGMDAQVDDRYVDPVDAEPFVIHDGLTPEEAGRLAGRRILRDAFAPIRAPLPVPATPASETPHRPVDQPVKSRYQHRPHEPICEECGHAWRAPCHDWISAEYPATPASEDDQRGVKLADFLTESSYLRCAWIEPEYPGEVASLILQFLGLDPTAALRRATPAETGLREGNDWPWRFAHAAGIPGLPWDIYTATGDVLRDYLVASVTEKADAAQIVASHNAALSESPEREDQ